MLAALKPVALAEVELRRRAKVTSSAQRLTPVALGVAAVALILLAEVNLPEFHAGWCAPGIARCEYLNRGH